MSDSRDLLPGQQDPTDLPANQVQFALVISRMLDTVKGDAEARRQMVYDLARYKLQEQFTYADAKNIDNMKQALEVAIDEVEATRLFCHQRSGRPAASGRRSPARSCR